MQAINEARERLEQLLKKPLEEADPIELSKAYKALREKIRQSEERLRALKQLSEVLEAELLRIMPEQGVDRIVVGGYMIAPVDSDVVRVTDWSALYDWLVEHNGIDFLQQRVKRAAVLEYLEAHGELPPGLDLTRIRKIRMTKTK